MGPSIPAYFESTLDMLPGVLVPLRSMFLPLRGVLISPVGTAQERAIMPSVGPDATLEQLVFEALRHCPKPRG